MGDRSATVCRCRPAAQSRRVRGAAGPRPLGRGRLRLFHQAHRRMPTTSACCSTRRLCSRSPGITRRSTASRAASIRRARRIQRLRGAWRIPMRSSRRRVTVDSAGRREPATSESTTIRSSTSTTNLQYVFNKPRGAWAALMAVRLGSGRRGGPESATMRWALTADQQAAIGLFCGSKVATRDSPITSCTSSTAARSD